MQSQQLFMLLMLAIVVNATKCDVLDKLQVNANIETPRAGGAMGYEVHITRAEEWSESDEIPITLEEWTRYAVPANGYRMDGFAETKLRDGKVLRIQQDGLAVWTGYSRHVEGKTMAWFGWRDGRITVRNPDAEVVAEMKVLAGHFAASVQGDEGEHY